MTFSKKVILLFIASPIVSTLASCKRISWESPDNYLYPTHKLTNLVSIPPDKSPTGKGIKVGIIDSGIDFTHPALGGCFGKECRVQYGKSFATSYAFLPTHLEGTPYDNVGHGTAIAGIIGGNDENIMGVAPDVIFGAYKLDNSTTPPSDTFFMDSIQQALQDGMDIIVICRGFMIRTIETELSKLNFGKTIVIVAAGNYGKDFRIFGIANKNEFITVASMSSSYNEVNEITLNDAYIEKLDYFFVFPDRPYELFNENWTLLRDDENACTAFMDPSLTGKVVLLTHSNCSIEAKVENLKMSNVAGVVVYAEDKNEFHFNYNYIPNVPVAGIQISKNRLKEIFKVQTQVVATRNPTRFVLQDGEGNVSDFSSWGPAKNNDIKPDITAPGESVTTTFPMNRGKYKSVVGTSFAAPYIAGLAALFLEVNPNATPNDFSTALMNTAIPIRKKLVSNSMAVTVARQGAGAVNAYGLLMNKVTASPRKITLGNIKKGSITFPLTIHNKGHLHKVFTIGHLPSSLPGNEYFWDRDYLKLDIFPYLQTYSISPGSFIEIKVTFSIQKEYLNDFLSGYIYLKEISTNETIHIPYLGKT